MEFRIGDIVYVKQALEESRWGTGHATPAEIIELVDHICHGGTQRFAVLVAHDGKSVRYPMHCLVSKDDPSVAEAMDSWHKALRLKRKVEWGGE